MRETTLFVAACCRWPQDRDAVGQAASRVRDWDEARQAVMRHRVAPLVHVAVQGLASVPQTFRAWLEGDAHEMALHGLRMARDCMDLDTAWRAEGIVPVHIKGPVLAQMAYGSVTLKFSGDLDVFVTAAQAAAAMDVLERRGYRAEGQGGKVSAAQARAVIRNCKDLKFVKPTGPPVELHWQMSNIKAQLSGMAHDPQMQSVRVANYAEVQTLNTAQLVPYLCVHGAKHNWMRLKWLADVAAYLQQLSQDERDRVIEEVGRSSEADALAQTLKLCDTFFGTQYDPKMSPRADALYRYAKARIDLPMTRPKSLLGDWTVIRDIAVTRHLNPSKWAAIWALRTHLIGQDDVMAMPLPAALNGLYPLIRVPSFLFRRARLTLSRRAQRSQTAESGARPPQP